MLLSKRCPHTDVLNFYDASEPHIAIGSITKCGRSAVTTGYAWRFHEADNVRSGRAPDVFSAERDLRALLFSVTAAREIAHRCERD